MSANHDPRKSLGDARRIVIKIGSRSVVGGANHAFVRLAAQVKALRDQDRSVVVVSSGAIALGMRRLGLDRRPSEIGRLQAAAAAGQSLLMQAYEQAFAAHSIEVGQVLLTHADLTDRDRFLNARAALEALLELSAVPVVNENDTVAVEEIRFGDNDQLAAMVTTLVSADLLIMLTHVEGLLDAQGKRVSVVADATEAIRLVQPKKSDEGSGGMSSKVEAARRATMRGVPVVIADASAAEVVTQILDGKDVGTLFLPHGSPMASRKHWIGYVLKPKGVILVDQGAVKALRSGGRSLLPAGVTGARGDFEAGDAVQIVGPDGTELGKGLARYGLRDVARLAGAQTKDIEARIGRTGGDEIVHRDDLVLSG